LDGARVLGAVRVIAIDDVPYRPEMAGAQGHETIDYSDTDVRSALLELTGGRGPGTCIDAVGMEATHGATHVQLYDRLSCRRGGIVSVYGGLIDTEERREKVVLSP
jgi:threonine dehydrogenase-like Zn-dependent dehydrogenase